MQVAKLKDDSGIIEFEGLCKEFKIPEDWKEVYRISTGDIFKSTHLSIRDSFIKAHLFTKDLY